MLKNDVWIAEQAKLGMIVPFNKSLMRVVEKPIPRKIISYGAGSYGYDIRLSSLDFRIFRHIPGTVVDPKRFTQDHLEPAPLYVDGDGSQYFIIPANSYGLGVAVERLLIPDNITAICLGKSTYARCGLIVNMTPAEAGWEGYLTLEISNASSADCRVYANEGIAQLLFLEGEPCQTTYSDRAGKYQGQGQQVTLARL